MLSQREIQMVKDADVHLRIKYRMHKWYHGKNYNFLHLPRSNRAKSLAVKWEMCAV